MQRLLRAESIPEEIQSKSKKPIRCSSWIVWQNSKQQEMPRIPQVRHQLAICNVRFVQHSSMADLDWYSNGCTASPDQPLGYNFLPSCQRHDFGYHNYKNQDRFTEQNKDRIDSNFKSDMYNECATRGSVSKTVCEGIADIYYEAVSTFGGRR